MCSTTAKLFNLPLEVILKNNISLSYFIDFMSAIGTGSSCYSCVLVVVLVIFVNFRNYSELDTWLLIGTSFLYIWHIVFGSMLLL